MKYMSIIALCLSVVLSGCISRPPDAATPSAVHDLVSQIKPDMPTNELARLFGVKGQMGPWSGQTGYFEYSLPSGQKVSVSCYSRDGLKHSFVHSNVTVYVQEKPGQQMKQIR